MKSKTRSVFLIFLAAALMLLACSCAAKPSEPVRSAAFGGDSDALSEYAEYFGLGDEADSDALRKFNDVQYFTDYTPKNTELCITLEGKEYTVKYSSTRLYRPASPVATDEYFCKDENGDSIRVVFAQGDTSKIIGYYMGISKYSDFDGWSDMNKLPEEELVELARKAAAKYTDISYYNDHGIEYFEGYGRNMCGWYTIYFYASVNGVRAADLAEVRMYPDGQVWWVMTQPTTGIAKSVSSKLNAAACDDYAEEQLTQMYGKAYASFEYSSHELLRRELSLDDDGNPVIIYTYKVELNTDKGGSLFNTVTDFATVGVWLG